MAMIDNPTMAPGTRLSGSWLVAAQIAWVLLFAITVGLFLLGAVDKFVQPLPDDCARVECNPIEFTADDVAVLGDGWAPAALFTILMPIANLAFNLGFLAVAVILFWRKRDDWIALLLSIVLAILGGVAFSPANDVLQRSRPALTPLVVAIQMPAYVGLMFLLVLFPDGRLAPNRRWLWGLFLALAILFLLQPTSLIGLLAQLAFVVLALASQVYRYRQVSGLVQRQQTKWGLLGVACAIFIFLSWGVTAAFFPPDEPTAARTYALLIIWLLLLGAGLLMPGAFAVAILRYRLWEIDVIIRRTLVYAALTGLLALAYFGAVVLLQSLFHGLTGQDSDLAIVISTLSIAALFAPLRRRVQAFFDRRFYRRGYDAAQALQRFSRTARDEVDLDVLVRELEGMVAETMQPEQVSVWLRDGERRTEDGRGERR